ncbi:MAG: Ig-like domain-containing protein [Spirochaetota bacterium]
MKRKMKHKNSALLLVLFPLLLSTGCSFISLSKLSVSTFPAERNQVIDPASDLWIDFSVPVNTEKTAELIKVLREGSAQTGDIRWEEGRLLFKPAPPLLLGVRHLFACKGTVEALDGRHFDLTIEIPFYPGSMNPAPRLINFSPSADIAGIKTPLVLEFSTAMNRESFKNGFSLNPAAEHEEAWDLSSKLVTINPKKQWNNLAVYTWQLNEKLKSAEGLTLPELYSGSFVVQEDSSAPDVFDIGPGDPVIVSRLPGDLNKLRYRDIILMVFTEDVTIESLSSEFNLNPTVGGSLQRLDIAQFAFLPEQGYTMDTLYHLTIGKGVQDLSGNSMLFDYDTWFKPDIPLQKVTLIRNNPGPDFLPPYNSETAVSVDFSGPDNTHTFTIQFSRPFSDAFRAKTVPLITCQPFFPPGLLTVNLENAGWNPGGNEISLTWSGFTKSTVQQTNYYKLFIKGGADGVINSDGSFLKEDVRLVLKAAQ